MDQDKVLNLNRSDTAIRVTYVSIIWGVFLIIAKFASGFIGNSSALVADAVHSISDLLSDAILLAGFFILKQPEDSEHNYGHGKFETLSAASVGILLIAAGLGIGIANIEKISDFFSGRDYPIPGSVALAGALFSIIVKEFLFKYTINASKKLNSSALKANAWHHRSDALTSITTLFGVGAALILGGRWWVLDAVAGFLISFFILWMGFSIARESIGDLMERSLGEDARNKIIEISRKIKGLENPHNIKTRKIGSDAAIELHICIDGETTVAKAHIMVIEYEKRLAMEFGDNTFITIHIDPLNDNILD